MHRANIPSEHQHNGNANSKNAPNPYTDSTPVPMLILGCLNIGRDILLHPRCSAKASVLTHVAEIVEMHPLRVCVGSYMHMHWHCD